MFIIARKGAGSQAGRRQRSRYAPAIDVLEGRALLSTITVENNADSGPGSLRDAIAAAASGDTINFDPSLAGETITLTSGQLVINKSLTIDGLGSQELTVSGNHASRVFEIRRQSSTPVNVSISGLTVADGMATNASGGGIDEFVTSLSLTDCRFTGNEAGHFGGALNIGGGTVTIDVSSFEDNTVTSTTSFVLGGAIFNGAGTLSVTNSQFLDNQAVASGRQFSQGGAILNSASIPVFSNNVLIGNKSIGGQTGGQGGAIYNSVLGIKGMAISDCWFQDNEATALSVASGVAGMAFGGALESDGAPLSVTDSTFVGNLAQGGDAGNAGTVSNAGSAQGGAIFLSSSSFGRPAPTLTFSNVAFLSNQAVGGSSTSPAHSSAGFASGGALTDFGAKVDMQDCAFIDNAAIGGSGFGTSFQGAADGGAVMDAFNANMTVNHGLFVNNTAQGGSGDVRGFDAHGGAIRVLTASLTLTNSHLSANRAIGGDSSAPGGTGGAGQGGGVYVSNFTSPNTVCIQNDMITGNKADGGEGGDGGTDGPGVGGGVYIDSGKVGIVNSKVKGNHASTSDDNIFGTFSTTC